MKPKTELEMSEKIIKEINHATTLRELEEVLSRGELTNNLEGPLFVRTMMVLEKKKMKLGGKSWLKDFQEFVP